MFGSKPVRFGSFRTIAGSPSGLLAVDVVDEEEDSDGCDWEEADASGVVGCDAMANALDSTLSVLGFKLTRLSPPVS